MTSGAQKLPLYNQPPLRTVTWWKMNYRHWNGWKTTNTVILPSCEGCGIVIMDKKDYSDKMNSLFNDKKTRKLANLEQTALNRCQPLPTPYKRLFSRKQEHIVYFSYLLRIKDFTDKMDSVVKDKQTYEPLKGDPTLQRRLNGKPLDLKKTETIDIQLYYRLKHKIGINFNQGLRFFRKLHVRVLIIFSFFVIWTSVLYASDDCGVFLKIWCAGNLGQSCSKHGWC